MTYDRARRVLVVFGGINTATPSMDNTETWEWSAAAGFAKRKTPLETFDAVDPNRKLTLEESPWLLEAKGGKDSHGKTPGLTGVCSCPRNLQAHSADITDRQT